MQKKPSQNSFEFASEPRRSDVKRGVGIVKEFPTQAVRGRVEKEFRSKVVSHLIRTRIVKD